MHDAQFLNLVRALRDAQKEYFATRSKESLDRAKSLCYEVDEAIAEHDRTAAADEESRSHKLLHLAYSACREAIPVGQALPDDFVVRVGRRFGVSKHVLADWACSEAKS